MIIGSRLPGCGAEKRTHHSSPPDVSRRFIQVRSKVVPSRRAKRGGTKKGKWPKENLFNREILNSLVFSHGHQRQTRMALRCVGNGDSPSLSCLSRTLQWLCFMPLTRACGHFDATAARKNTDKLDVPTPHNKATAFIAPPNAKNVLSTATMYRHPLTGPTRPPVAITSPQFANIVNCTILTMTVTHDLKAFSSVTTTLN